MYALVALFRILPADRHLERRPLPAAGGIDVTYVRGRRLGARGGREGEKASRVARAKLTGPRAVPARTSSDGLRIAGL